MKPVDDDVIAEVSKILAELKTGTEITKMLAKLNFFDYDTYHNQKNLSTKWKRLEHAIIHKCKLSTCHERVNCCSYLTNEELKLNI